LPTAESEEGEPRIREEPDGVFQTRRAVRFGITPEEARIFVDGRYIGLADDWDGRGGGREYEFSRRGGHLVHIGLPGYRDLDLELVVTSAVEEEVLELDTALERESFAAYRRFPRVAARTTAAVEFAVEPADAVLSEGGEVFGRANSFSSVNPLQLTGPAVHDLVLSAPGHEPKMVRVLVARNAGQARTRIQVSLKRKNPEQ